MRLIIPQEVLRTPRGVKGRLARVPEMSLVPIVSTVASIIALLSAFPGTLTYSYY